MPTHWTYADFGLNDDLIQGDILVPSKGIRAVFKEVHPHFLDPKYTNFLVTTQSCDMVRRQGPCSTRYLNIAVVRQLEDVLHDFLSHVCNPVASQVYYHESKGEARLLLQRLFNQNEQALGLFYLHEDADAGVAVPSVALLRVGITLRVDHYDLLVQSRCGRLRPEFTAKLGWLVGNLYARVGTPDWSEPPERKGQLDKLIHETLDAEDSEVAPLWVRKSLVDEARNNGVNFENFSPSELEQELKKHKPPAVKERVINRATEIVKEVVPDVTEDQLKKMINRLNNDQLFAKTLKAEKLE